MSISVTECPLSFPTGKTVGLWGPFHCGLCSSGGEVIPSESNHSSYSPNLVFLGLCGLRGASTSPLGSEIFIMMFLP